VRPSRSDALPAADDLVLEAADADAGVPRVAAIRAALTAVVSAAIPPRVPAPAMVMTAGTRADEGGVKVAPSNGCGTRASSKPRSTIESMMLP